MDTQFDCIIAFTFQQIIMHRAARLLLLVVFHSLIRALLSQIVATSVVNSIFLFNPVPLANFDLELHLVLVVFVFIELMLETVSMD